VKVSRRRVRSVVDEQSTAAVLEEELTAPSARRDGLGIPGDD
jgi:hypothetical protein